MPRLLGMIAVGLAGCGDNLHLAADAGDATPTACAVKPGNTIVMEPIAMVEGTPVFVASPPADPRLFVVVREGTIRLIKDGALLPDPFLDLSSSVYLADTVERGLLGLAFHPDYATNGQFFVYYTTAVYGVLARCAANPDDPDRAQPTCLPTLLVLHDRAGNHNGGMLEFGPDGFLYVGTGDGGGAGDPNKNAQNPYNLLGKILRIDVDHPQGGLEYGIPPDNPYAGGGGAPEVFIRGARNPWRFSFDSATADLWIGDVGQNRAEEEDLLHRWQQSGADLGWSLYEGDGCCATQADLCFEQNPLPCDPTGLTFPRDTRDRTTPRGDSWYAIIDGDTYRGSCYPDLVGHHFYSDCWSGVLVDAQLQADDSLRLVDTVDPAGTGTTSMHAAYGGEIYVTKYAGMVYHLAAAP